MPNDAAKLFGTLRDVALRTKAGVPTDADFPVPRDGLQVLDTTNDRVWVRLGGAWRLAPVGLDYVEFTANVNITATAVGSANTVVTSNALTFDGSTKIEVRFFAASVTVPNIAASNSISLYLFEDGAVVGLMGDIFAQASTVHEAPMHLSRQFTPSAGSHTYSIRGTIGAAGTGTVGAGVGTGGAKMPGFISIAAA